MDNYVQKAITTKISATSRASIKIKDSYYTLEYCEERTIPDVEGIDLETEKKILWDDVNREVDQQVEDICNALKNNR